MSLPALLGSLLVAGFATGEPHVLIIGVDGTRPDAVRAASTPTLDGLAMDGAASHAAFAGGALDPADATHQDTSSGPGWASILTGVWADRHGFYGNGDFVVGGGNLQNYPHFFAHVRASIPDAELSSIVQWHPINRVMLDPFAGLATYTEEVADSGFAVEAAVVQHLSSADPKVLFVHFDDVDHAGHSDGFHRHVTPYLAAIEATDAHIGAILDAVAARPNADSEDWLTIVVTDHGGDGTSHGGHSYSERTIFLYASGGGTPVERYTQGPGHVAVVATALHHLGIAVDPGWELADESAFGRPQARASHPTPADATSPFPTRLRLDWLEATETLSQTLYLGTGSNLGPADIVSTPAESWFDTALLEPATRYYWRVDTDTPGGTVVGDVWSFVTSGPLLDDLVVHLDLEGDLDDVSGRDNDAVALGDPAYRRGRTGTGLRLDGAGDSVSLGGPADLEFGRRVDFSLSLWVRSNGWSGDPVFASNKDWASGSNTGWVVAGDDDGTNWQWNLRGQNGSRVDFERAGHIGDGAWHHLAVSHDRTGAATFYQDGLRVGEVDIRGQGSVDSGLATAIGQDGTLNYPLELAGRIEEVRLWRRALGAHEVRQLYGDSPSSPWNRIVGGVRGDNGVPELTGSGTLVPGAPLTLDLVRARASSTSVLVVGLEALNRRLGSGSLIPSPSLLVPRVTDPSGAWRLDASLPAGLPSNTWLFLQTLVVDAEAESGLAASNAVSGLTR